MTQKELADHPLTSELARCGNLFHHWQWSLSSSSNYSALLPSGEMVISRSGIDKEMMTSADFMLVDLSGKSLANFEEVRPSAETELHCHVYRTVPSARAALHTHSKYAVYFSRKAASSGKIIFSGFEMQKIFEGIDTHLSTVEIPVFLNSQDMRDIVKAFDAYLAGNPLPPAYLIEGHGVYTWGKTVLHAKQKLEAIEYLMELKYMEES